MKSGLLNIFIAPKTQEVSNTQIYVFAVVQALSTNLILQYCAPEEILKIERIFTTT